MNGPTRCSRPTVKRKEHLKVKIFLEQVSEYQFLKRAVLEGVRK
jgi:hypothetical protein